MKEMTIQDKSNSTTGHYDLVAFIPARGGSKRLHRKNLLEVGAHGETLLYQAISNCHMVGVVQVIVSTDDKEIADYVSLLSDVTVEMRPVGLETDTATVDQVVTDFLSREGGPVLVYQPTVVLEDISMLSAFLEKTAWRRPKPHGVAMGVRAHAVWVNANFPVLKERSNSQYESDHPIQEVGVRFYSNQCESGVVGSVAYVEGVAVDVDTALDLRTAQTVYRKKSILFRIRYGRGVGSGHYRRALQLALELQHHDVSFQVEGEEVPYLPFPRRVVYQADANVDLIVNDRLDTTAYDMVRLKYEQPFARIVNFEDHGPGAKLADVVINDLYPASGLDNELVGSDYSVLRSEFVTAWRWPDASLVGVTFGGTDPANLTERVNNFARDRSEEWRFVTPPSWPEERRVYPTWSNGLASLFANSRFVITSAGRTLYEAAAVGTPALVIAQNVRESTHSHLGPEYGNIYLGHATMVSNDTLDRAIDQMVKDNDLIDELSHNAVTSIDGKGLRRVLNILERELLY